MRISPLVIIGCYQLTDMIPPPAATTLMLPDIHSIEFLDGWYVAHAPPATFWSVKCMEVAEVKDLMNCTNQWLKTIINLVNFAAQTQIRRSEPTFTALKPRGSCLENSTFLQSLLSLDFDIGRVGLYLTNCIKLLTQAAWGHLGLHYAKKTSGKELKLADLVWGSTLPEVALNQWNNQIRIISAFAPGYESNIAKIDRIKSNQIKGWWETNTNQIR